MTSQTIHPIQSANPASFLTKGCCINNIVLNKIDGIPDQKNDISNNSPHPISLPSILFNTMLFIQQPFVKKLKGWLIGWGGWLKISFSDLVYRALIPPPRDKVSTSGRGEEGKEGSLSLSISLYVYVCIYIYIERERERER